MSIHLSAVFTYASNLTPRISFPKSRYACSAISSSSFSFFSSGEEFSDAAIFTSPISSSGIMSSAIHLQISGSLITRANIKSFVKGLKSSLFCALSFCCFSSVIVFSPFLFVFRNRKTHNKKPLKLKLHSAQTAYLCVFTNSLCYHFTTPYFYSQFLFYFFL